MAFDIKTLLKPYIQANNEWKFKLIQDWHAIMGSLAHNVSLEKVTQDTIVLGVSDSCWMQELYLLSPVLLQTINQSLDQPRIKHIRFKQVGRREKIQKKQHSLPLNNPQKVVLNAKQEKALARITDQTLRSALESFLMRCQEESKR